MKGRGALPVERVKWLYELNELHEFHREQTTRRQTETQNIPEAVCAGRVQEARGDLINTSLQRGVAPASHCFNPFKGFPRPRRDFEDS